MNRNIGIVVIYMCLFCGDNSANAQDTGVQLWLEYDLNVPLEKSWLFGTEAYYQELISAGDTWKSLNLEPKVEKNVLPFLDLTFEAPMSYTFQTSSINSFEIRLAPGARFYITKNRRIDTRIFQKWETRFYHEQGDEDWTTSNRLRIRGESRVAINHPKNSGDRLLYGIVEAEVFFVMGRDVPERYANRIRINGGLGYRFSYAWRLEIIYMLQESRKKTDEENDVTHESIIRIRFKHYLNKGK